MLMWAHGVVLVEMGVGGGGCILWAHSAVLMEMGVEEGSIP